MLAILAFVPIALARPAAAEGVAPAPGATTAEALVRSQLVEPLAVKERDQSRFSRARLPARERRVRILDDQARTDARGARFFSFAIDERHGFGPVTGDDAAQWRLATVTGCAYVERGEVFVKSGDQHRPAAFLLGKNLKPTAAPVCGAASAS